MCFRQLTSYKLYLQPTAYELFPGAQLSRAEQRGLVEGRQQLSCSLSHLILRELV